LILEARNIHKSYPGVTNNSAGLHVLKGITCSVSEGEIISIVGPSGAGKSTLLHILGGLDRPTSGEVRFRGKSIFEMNDSQLAHFRNREIGFIFQFHHLLPEFTALENVAMPAMIQGYRFEKVRSAAMRLLADVGLGERLEHKPGELSGGEQQRVAVARALMNRPALILADEPSGNLDSENSQLLHELLWNLSKSRQQTFVIATHNEGLAARSDRVLKIADGQLQT
jgi:lipoprotein-releasing system ATP-binding protein